MNARLLGLLTLLVAWICLSPVARSQISDAPPATFAVPDSTQASDLAKLKKRVAELETQVLQITENVNKVSKLIEDQNLVLDQLRGKMDASLKLIDEQFVGQKQILDAISRPDSQGRPIVALSNIMQSDEFREELSNAVYDSVREEGTLWVYNRTRNWQLLRVNAQLRLIRPASAPIAIPVKLGKLTTELVDQEPPRTWTVSSPTYLVAMEIR